ncbi:MAG: potassium channel family protein, partial [Nitrospirae bacterium]|nr:potassium channel family protein [Nitrospirota bacterium]
MADAAARHGLSVLTRTPPQGDCCFAPASETCLETGDRLTVVTRKQSWDRLAEPAAPHAQVSRSFISLRRWFRDQLNLASLPSFVAQIWKNASAPLRTVFLVLLVLIAISVLVFHLGMDLSPVDSLYFVMTTVTTVGYGDITPRATHTWLKLYACLLMLLGSAFVATLY